MVRARWASVPCDSVLTAPRGSHLPEPFCRPIREPESLECPRLSREFTDASQPQVATVRFWARRAVVKQTSPTIGR